MAYSRCTSYDVDLEDLPFPIPRALHQCGLVSPNLDETLENIEQYIKWKEYATAAALLTILLQQQGDLFSHPPLLASLFCKRADCLLKMNYLPYVMRDCQIAKNVLGNVLDEHAAFLHLRALELQGEIEEAFGYAVIYRHLDPKMTRDKGAVHRLREKVRRLCEQGYGNQYHICKIINILMSRGDRSLLQGSTQLALTMYTEVINLFPGVLESYEQRAQCYLTLGDLPKANQDCNRALNMSDRTSTAAFYTKIEIKIQLEEFGEALELAREWQRIDPENFELCGIEGEIRNKMTEKQSSSKKSQSRSVTDLSRLGHDSGDHGEQPKPTVRRPPIRASKQSSGTKPRSKKDLKREEQRREQERQQIAQEIEEKQKEMERKLAKDRKVAKNDEQHAANEKMAGALPAELATSDVLSSLPEGPSFPERSRKRRLRRKTRNLRSKREESADDSDASSVCSISTCPGDLLHRRNPRNRPKMPVFSDFETSAMSDHPNSSSRQKQPYKPQRAATAIRPRPHGVYGKYQVCSQYNLNQTCSKGQKCRFAHGENERRAWEEEREKGKKKTKNQNASGGASFLKDFRGNCRAPPRILNNGGKYRMCPKWTKGTCKLGKGCTFAHGEEELKAWNEHVESMNMERKKESEKQSKEKRNDDSANTSLGKDRALKRPAPTYQVDELVSSVTGVTVSYEPKELNVPLQIPLNTEGKVSQCWTIRVNYESQETCHLQHIVLLPHHHKCYTLSSVKFKCTVPSPVVKPLEHCILTDELHYAVEPYFHSLNGSCEVEIVVTFSTLVFGSFAQVLVLDFGGESAQLALKMNVEVGSQEFLQEYGEEKSKLTLDWTRWDDGTRKIVKFEPKQPSVFSNDDLLDKAEYKLPPEEKMVPCPLLDKSQGLRPQNYKEVMHQLLFVEEFYIRKQIASFNVEEVNLQATKLVVKREEVLCAQLHEGWLYGSFHVTRPITPDDAEGRLLLRNLFRSLGSVLIGKSGADSVGYEALVDSVEDSRVILKLSQRCCKELELSHNTFVTVNVQFYINRLPLCEMHDNIDRLGPEHFRILFTELGNDGPQEKIHRLQWILDENLNEDQEEIICKIAAPAIDAPPLVVFGPFGTGKTHTLNQAIRRIAVNQNNRVLICTHSNSAADLHVLLLDNYLKKPLSITACKPLRIYTPLRKHSTVSDTVKKYCLIADKGTPEEAFRLPTRDDVIGHRVIISTLGMSRALFDMKLRRGFFSHILIDEAAQALETETLTPLTLAGNNTKVVFTGDHMQMSPDVFSPQAKKWGFQISLQERLFYDYTRRQSGSKLDPNLIFLIKNYRSNEQLLQFSSDMFYTRELSSGSKQPLHPKLGPFVFYAALGKEELEENHASYRNLAEVNEVVKRVMELSDSWPEKWGPRDLKQIAVVSSYRYQVKTIRDGLRKVGLGDVGVETIENVQGKQFRALFVSTVRTYHTYKDPQDSGASETESPYLYFLSDPKLLNTALTRAQSLIAVVGDPFSLRTIGDCQVVWEEFIKRCIDKGKLFGIEHNELENRISLSGLNVHATEFVPAGTEANSQPPGSDGDSPCSSSTLAPKPDDTTEEKRIRSSSFDGTNHSNEIDVADHNYVSDYSDEAGDEMSESDDLDNADDFAEYGNIDETVPPKHMDPIIQALREACEEKKLKKKLRDEANSDESAMCGKHNPKEKTDNVGLDLTPSNCNTAGSKVVHEDINMKLKRGKTELFLLNLTYKYSERTERLISTPKVQHQECLQQEYLLRLLNDDPELYRKCTLRVGSGGAQTSHGEIQDAESEDILIEGNTRQTFDRDVVVVKLSQKPSNGSCEVQGTSEPLRGSIQGVLHHVTNLRERQFVCTISRNDPRVMYPINKSMRPIANLADESCDGIPIYRKIQPGSDEKLVSVRILPRNEALSGKFFFVVQYLQWKRQFPRPLGIVTKTIRRSNDLCDTYKALKLEYNLKKEFPEEVTREVEWNIERWASIPNSERNSRRLVQNVFTIDPPRSTALDDALTIEQLENGLFKVGVHIADVSYYVRVGSKIDDEARKRGTSYFGGSRYGDVLMLPPTLSHKICSLLPNEERLAVSVYLKLDQHGRIQDDEELDFCRSIVKSQCRLTYAQAQKVILGKPVRCEPENGELKPEVEESIRKLNDLAQKRREIRLGDGSYFHFEYPDRNKDLEAHELVEEMMILTNTAVGNYLVRTKSDRLPLRIQRPPKTKQLNEWRDGFMKSAQLSLSLRRHFNVPRNDEIVAQLSVPTPTWLRISSARRDHRELKLLVCNDNLYPQLAVAHSTLKSLQRKAEDVIAAEVPREDRLHWSLNVREYTRFTSPIRRYFDIVVHRLLFETARQEVVADHDDIGNVYRQCSFLSEQSSRFEKDCARAEVAAKFSTGSCKLSAFVEMVGQDFIRLHLLSETNQYLSEKQRKIQISHLGPTEQPKQNETTRSLELKWKLRVYDASAENVKLANSCRKVKRQLLEDKFRIQALFSGSASDERTGYHLPSNLWLDVLKAVKESDERRLTECLDNLNEVIDSQKRERQEREVRSSKTFFKHCQAILQELEDEIDEDDEEDESDDTEDGRYISDSDDDNDFEEMKTCGQAEEQNEARGQCFADQAHFVETSLDLKVSDTFRVQLSANNSAGGLMSPEIQLFNLAPGIDICIEHKKLPDTCFSITSSNKASQPTYKSIGRYVHLWRPVLCMEAATVAVRNDDTIILKNLDVKWKRGENGKLLGNFQLNKNFCETRQIEIFQDDYACVKVHHSTSSSSLLTSSCQKNGDDRNEKMGREAVAGQACEISSEAHMKHKTASDDEEDDPESLGVQGYWVGHCTFTEALTSSDDSLMKCTLKLFQSSMTVPEEFTNGNGWPCTVEIIKQTVPSRRMISTLVELPKMKEREASLAREICLGKALRLPDRPIALPSEQLSITNHVNGCNLNELNDLQVTAVRRSLRQSFTLIQGPPGTGKTVTGVHIAYWFARINHIEFYGDIKPQDTPKKEIPEEAPPQVLYCGPSNKSVDVVAEYLMRIPDLKILRIYGNVIEEEEFPVPNQVRHTRKSAIHQVSQDLKVVALHHVIRDKERSPYYAARLKEYEDKFAWLKKKKKKVKDDDVESYLKTIHKAEKWVIRSVCQGSYHQIILCTCSAAGSKRISKACNNTAQCIVDESGMCLEPETIVPIARSKAKQVVLIGDHKQLQPIVTNKVARSLGLRISLFERYSSDALMLEEQYRMHNDICEFPSNQFYDGRLKTALSVRERHLDREVYKKLIEFWPKHTATDYVPLAFCNVVGEEEELVVTTDVGNERSKSNVKEKDKVVEVIKKLLDCGVKKDQIVILSPYRAQCHIISEDLANHPHLSEIAVMSIVKSQGSESDFVVISLVRSLPVSQIDPEPNRGWLGERLGFVTDEHQINVALTRAKRGLCIIGNKNLLQVCEMWRSLIDNYNRKSCLVDSEHWPIP